MEDIISIAKKVLQTEGEAVLALAQRLNHDFGKAVSIIFDCKGRVVVTGMGKSGLVGKKIAATLASTGTPSFFLHPAEASHGDLGMVTSRDVILAISNSGETDELISLLPFLKRFSVGLISMTGSSISTLARFADVNLDISVKEEACPFGIIPTSSTTAALAMGDALAVAILTKKGIGQEDFANYHPAGTLGKKLLIKVKDLMTTGDAIPVVSPSFNMTKAVIEISSKRLGLTIVADEDGRILGIITDGDLRRGIERCGRDFYDMKAGEVMIKNPKTIAEDELAAKALSIMEKHSITSLIVPDSEGKIRGIIHIHDILRKGIL
jgi:arabinose-5-phosphate isomerase